MDPHTNEISDWQSVVNKPAYADDGEEVGIVRSIQSENLLVDYGPITPDHFLIPRLSVKGFDNGIVRLDKGSKGDSFDLFIAISYLIVTYKEIISFNSFILEYS